MIKAILMIYLFTPFLILSIMTDTKELIGLSMGVAYGCGMLTHHFIAIAAKGESK